MLKHLLHLYNDGHEPFPHMKGGMVHEESKEEVRQQEEKDGENEGEDLNALWEEMNEKESDYEALKALWEELNEKEAEKERTKEAMKKQYEEHRFNPDVRDDLSILKALDPTMKFNKLHPHIRESILDSIESSLKNAKKAGYDDDELKDVFEDELKELKETKFMDMVYDAEYPEDADVDVESEEFLRLPLKEKRDLYLTSYNKIKFLKDSIEEKLEKLKIKKDKLYIPVSNELQKYGKIFLYNKEKGLKKDDALRWAKTIISLTSSITEKNRMTSDFVAPIHATLSKLPKDELINLYIYSDFYIETKKQSAKELTKFNFIKEMILDIVYPEYAKVSDEYTELRNSHTKIKDKYYDLIERGKVVLKETTKEQKSVIKKGKVEEAEAKQEVREKKKLTHAEKLEADIQSRKDKQAQDLLDAKLLGDLGAAEPTKKSKPKKEKVVKEEKKSKEETDVELLRADAINRLSHIDTSMSPSGKDLETYLSGNGQSILQYITGDKSKVHDNEENSSIPDIQVKLSNGEMGSLRKAVTLDLYNSHNVYEIKNYKNYSITDSIIPVQETKFEGTGYFKPLYLDNGKLYNIELNYTDPTTGKKLRKMVMPENPNGRELNLIYRLSDGLYEFKPFAEGTSHVHLKQIGGMKTKAGKPLYDFVGANFDKCVDHYGNPSFNIQPFLRKIKT